MYTCIEQLSKVFPRGVPQVCDELLDAAPVGGNLPGRRRARLAEGVPVSRVRPAPPVVSRSRSLLVV